MLVLSAVLTVGAVWLGWWSTGGGVLGLLPGLMLGYLVGLLTFGMLVPFAVISADAGSMRQAKKALRVAEREGSSAAVLRARARLKFARWKRTWLRRS